MSKGAKNIYTCRKCCGHIVTVDLEEGVTPFMLKCRATKDCNGTMESSFYRVFDQEMRAGFEWYKPTAIHVLSAGERSHVEKGGLLLREANSSNGNQSQAKEGMSIADL